MKKAHTKNRRSITDTPVLPQESSASPKDNHGAAAARFSVTQTQRIGDDLRQAREERGDDLYRIAEYLCIRPNFLIALENSDYDTFPADAYVIGFLRTYANYLGLDGKIAIERYRQEMAGRRKKPTLLVREPLSSDHAPTPLLIIGGGLAALLLYIAWYSITATSHALPPPPPTITAESSIATNSTATEMPLASPTPQTLPTSLEKKPSSESQTAGTIVLPTAAPLPSTTANGIALTATSTPSTAPTTKDIQNSVVVSAQEPPTSSRLIIRALQASWILVNDNRGKVVVDRILKAGDSYSVPNQTGLSLTTGNGSGIVINLDGKDLPMLAIGTSKVVRNIPLDPSTITTAIQDRGD